MVVGLLTCGGVLYGQVTQLLSGSARACNLRHQRSRTWKTAESAQKTQEMKWMEKSKKSQETLDTHLRHDDDKGLNQLHSRSPSVSSHFTNCWVSLCTSWRQFQLFSLLHLFILDLFAYSLWRFKMRKWVFWGVLFTHTVGCSRPPSCKRCNCNKIENNRN